MPRTIRTAPTEYEEGLYAQGHHAVAGVDEAGRGPLAGPVVAAAVILPPGRTIPGVYDSKKMSAARREALAVEIKANALAYALGWADAALIDEINILQATFAAMNRALAALEIAPSAVLADGLPGRLSFPEGVYCQFITKGDAACHSIAAASILAKVARDAHMQKCHADYPQYGFDAHKGYGTARHMAALDAYGPCPLHRVVFLRKWQKG